MPNRISGNTYNKLFTRMDRDADGAVEPKEVTKHLKNAGVDAGFLGMVHNTAKDKFMKTLDADKSGGVTWDEFQGVTKDLLPSSVRDADGKIDADLANKTFEKLDRNGDGGVNRSELEKGTLDALPQDASFRGTTAEIAAKLGLDAFDANRDRLISREEFNTALSDADALLADDPAPSAVQSSGSED